MFVDSHCHLDLLDLNNYANGLTDVLAQCHLAKVEHILSVSVDFERLPILQQQAEQFKQVTFSAGLHPNELPGEIPSIEQIVAHSLHPKVVAIGETGLDTYRTEGDITWQKQRFRNHIYAAQQLDKPLIIHTRAVGQLSLDILEEEYGDKVNAVIHCFTEDQAYAERALELGCYISFSGIVTFKNAKELQAVAKIVPLEKMLIETDAPFLTPVPNRGKPNYPQHVVDVAKFLSEHLGVPLEKLAQQTTENFFSLFKGASAYR